MEDLAGLRVAPRVVGRSPGGGPGPRASRRRSDGMNAHRLERRDDAVAPEQRREPRDPRGEVVLAGLRAVVAQRGAGRRRDRVERPIEQLVVRIDVRDLEREPRRPSRRRSGRAVPRRERARIAVARSGGGGARRRDGSAARRSTRRRTARRAGGASARWRRRSPPATASASVDGCDRAPAGVTVVVTPPAVEPVVPERDPVVVDLDRAERPASPAADSRGPRRCRPCRRRDRARSRAARSSPSSSRSSTCSHSEPSIRRARVTLRSRHRERSVAAVLVGRVAAQLRVRQLDGVGVVVAVGPAQEGRLRRR